MNVIPYLNFDGTCREAFTFYAELFGGQPHFMTFGGTPAAEHVSPEAHDLLMHAYLETGDLVLMGSDSPDGRYERPQGTYVSLQVERVEDGERLFAALADGGQVTMPLEETFWVERFGMVTDRFGTPWMINAGASREAA